MFKTFFGKIWSGIKATPKTLIKFGKDIAATVVGIGYFIIWAPIACLAFYAAFFKRIGEIAFNSIRSMFKKAKGFKTSSATVEAV